MSVIQCIDDIPKSLWDSYTPEQKQLARSRLPQHKPEPIIYGKGKNPFRQAIVRELELRDANSAYPGYALVQAASKLVKQAIDGNSHALRELADRLDGKPQAEVAMAPGTEMQVQYVIRGPAVCKTREEFCQLTGSVVSPDVESG